MKYLVIILFLIGLGYIILPTGWTGQNKLFNKQLTNDWRDKVTDNYRDEFQGLHCSGFRFLNIFCYIKPFKLNHSPKLAATYISPLQKSTYLEEYYYPLRGSVIVNGYEPYDQQGKAFDKYSVPLIASDDKFNSEVTVKYNNSTIFSRLIVYLLVVLCGYWIFKTLKGLGVRFQGSGKRS